MESSQPLSPLLSRTVSHHNIDRLEKWWLGSCRLLPNLSFSNVFLLIRFLEWTLQRLCSLLSHMVGPASNPCGVTSDVNLSLGEDKCLPGLRTAELWSLPFHIGFLGNKSLSLSQSLEVGWGLTTTYWTRESLCMLFWIPPQGRFMRADFSFSFGKFRKYCMFWRTQGQLTSGVYGLFLRWELGKLNESEFVLTVTLIGSSFPERLKGNSKRIPNSKRAEDGAPLEPNVNFFSLWKRTCF